MALTRKLGYSGFFITGSYFKKINKVFVIGRCGLFLVLHALYVIKIPLIQAC